MLSTVYEIFEDADFRKRVQVATLELQLPAYSPESWYMEHGLKVAMQEPILTAFEKSKQAQPFHARRGFDPTIISDEMLLAGVLEVTTKLAKETEA